MLRAFLIARAPSISAGRRGRYGGREVERSDRPRAERGVGKDRSAASRRYRVRSHAEESDPPPGRARSRPGDGAAEVAGARRPLSSPRAADGRSRSGAGGRSAGPAGLLWENPAQPAWGVAGSPRWKGEGEKEARPRGLCRTSGHAASAVIVRVTMSRAMRHDPRIGATGS